MRSRTAWWRRRLRPSRLTPLGHPAAGLIARFSLPGRPSATGLTSGRVSPTAWWRRRLRPPPPAFAPLGHPGGLTSSPRIRLPGRPLCDRTHVRSRSPTTWWRRRLRPPAFAALGRRAAGLICAIQSPRPPPPALAPLGHPPPLRGGGEGEAQILHSDSSGASEIVAGSAVRISWTLALMAARSGIGWLR